MRQYIVLFLLSLFMVSCASSGGINVGADGFNDAVKVAEKIKDPGDRAAVIKSAFNSCSKTVKMLRKELRKKTDQIIELVAIHKDEITDKDKQIAEANARAIDEAGAVADLMKWGMVFIGFLMVGIIILFVLYIINKKKLSAVTGGFI